MSQNIKTIQFVLQVLNVISVQMKALSGCCDTLETPL